MRFYRRKIYFYGAFWAIFTKFSPFFAIIQLTSLVQNLVKSLTKSTVKNTPPAIKKARLQISPYLAFLHCNAPLGGCFAFVKPAYKFRTGCIFCFCTKPVFFIL